jgi:hypothetical protein
MEACAVLVGPMCFLSVADLLMMLGCMLTVALVAVGIWLAARRYDRRRREVEHPNPSCPARQGPDDGCIC